MNLRFVQITFLLVAVLFTVENIYNRFFTKKVTHHTMLILILTTVQTTITFETRNLADVDFPVFFSFLALPGFNISMLRTFGYGGELEFFSGFRMERNISELVWETDTESIEGENIVGPLKM